MKAKLIKLYTEHKCGKEWVGDYPADEVIVRLRKWNGGGHTDVILESIITVDGQVESKSVRILKPNTSDARAIRYAISVFDKLVTAHPMLGKENSDG